MSLLDDVSIVVTPNGYKAGELYAVVPVPTEGAEEITNGDFATDLSGWSTSGTNATNTITWETNGARIISTGTNIGLFQNTLIIGKTYRLTCDVAITVGKIGLDGATSGSTVNMVEGFNEIIFTAISTTFKIKRITGNDNCLLDNVSVKEYTSADMDVTRATAATRVDENGLVNYAEIIGSELVTCGDFSCAAPTNYWTATNAVISFANNQLTVDDTAGAGGDSRGSQVIITESGKTYRLTFNRISTTSLFYVGVGGGTSYNNIFYSSLGTDTGEYTLEFTATSSSSIIAFISGGNGITVFSNISVKEVTRDNVPRIDYTGGGCPHILAEPQRTNLVTYSEDFTQWGSDISGTGTTPVVTLNYATSPSGEQNASRLQLDIGSGTSSNDFSQLSEVITISNSTVYSRSIYFKSNTGSNQDIVIQTNGEGITTSTITTEWQRFEASPTSENTSGFIRIRIRGNEGTVSQADILVWGAQLEEGSYATSYIPTSGSTVTRNQDIFTRDGIGSLINSTEGVLFVEMAALSNDGTFRQLTLSDGTTANRILVDFTDTINQIRVFCGSGGVSQVSETFNVTSSLSFNKIAFKYKLNDFALWVNGVEVATDTSGITPIGLNKLSFNNGAGSFDFYGKVKQLQVYKTALTDEQLLQLTGESGTDFYESYAEMATALTYTIQ